MFKKLIALFTSLTVCFTSLYFYIKFALQNAAVSLVPGWHTPVWPPKAILGMVIQFFILFLGLFGLLYLTYKGVLNVLSKKRKE